MSKTREMTAADGDASVGGNGYASVEGNGDARVKGDGRARVGGDGRASVDGAQDGEYDTGPGEEPPTLASLWGAYPNHPGVPDSTADVGENGIPREITEALDYFHYLSVRCGEHDGGLGYEELFERCTDAGAEVVRLIRALLAPSPEREEGEPG